MLKQGQFCSPGFVVVVTTMGGGCYCQLVCRGQDAAEHLDCTGKGPATKKYLAPVVSSAPDEQLHSRRKPLCFACRGKAPAQ